MNDLVKRETEYLVFVERDHASRKTRVWEVRSKRWGDLLGYIQWYGRWRQYILFPERETAWNAGCLTDITTFLADAMADWRAQKVASPRGTIEAKAAPVP